MKGFRIMNSQERILRLFILLMGRKQISKSEMITAEAGLYQQAAGENDLANRKKRFQRDIQIIREVLQSTGHYRLEDNHRGVYRLIELETPATIDLNQETLAAKLAVMD